MTPSNFWITWVITRKSVWAGPVSFLIFHCNCNCWRYGTMRCTFQLALCHCTCRLQSASIIVCFSFLLWLSLSLSLSGLAVHETCLILPSFQTWYISMSQPRCPNPGRGRKRKCWDFTKVKKSSSAGHRAEDTTVKKPMTRADYISWRSHPEHPSHRRV